VAGKWRIRHKLMIGLALVVGIMGLLLGGALKGLASYRTTMNSMDSKLTELRSAQNVKLSVSELAAACQQKAVGDEKKEVKQTLDDSNIIHAVRYSPDGQMLVTLNLDFDKQTTTVVLWDLKTGKPKATFKPDSEWVPSGLLGVRTCTRTHVNLSSDAIALSPDGKTLAIGGAKKNGDKLSGTVTLWDVENQQVKRTLVGTPDTCITSVAFSPDGKTLATGSSGRKDKTPLGEVKLWKLSD